VPVVWTPGQDVVEYPSGTGIAVRGTDRFVVQVHYSLTAGVPPSPDSTTLRFRFAEKVARPLIFLLPDPLLESLFSSNGPDALPPREANVTYTREQTRAKLEIDDASPPVEILGVIPHMHELGKQYELRHLGSNGEDSCLARIDRWDFHWQKMYWYRTPPILSAGDALRFTCVYDTSRENNPVLPGWGTKNEMCLSALLVAMPPGM